ncbi:pre-mRNA polyadenylation factor fip-1-like [Cucumis melo var. makuwa]|uniref:Pre-mRNA polyadenylation factor fip-1-like n=1 Tax=Cucumis melo var. makuwa TaxID=1194695 RepID=A0A5D3BQ25_CUCMM|nr:pre-mRNA polyadenylation factor fip-1-like [Cucumis melo var. makuwa]TYK01871.1 pre-mRNA polyadenylation factor fip-1-like [Cucumis melo var. makuwa]
MAVVCKWAFTLKYKSDGILDLYKARLVTKAFTWTYGIGYLEKFSPVVKLNTVRVLLSIAINKKWPLHQLDVKNVFLNGDLEEEVHISFPSGFKEMGRTKDHPTDTPVKFTIKLGNFVDKVLTDKEKKTSKKCIDAYADSDWARSVTHRKSTCGYCTFMWGNLVTGKKGHVQPSPGLSYL